MNTESFLNSSASAGASAPALPMANKANVRARTRKYSAESSLICVLLSLSLGIPGALPARSWVETQFTAGTEGWSVVNWNGSGAPVEPAWHSTGGNPDGYIRGTDVHGDGFWRAPASFHGDWSAAYGGTLSYDAFAARNDWKMNDVYLAGNGQALSFWFPNNPASAWSTFSVKLDASAGWQYGWNYDVIGTPATEAQIRSVLSNVTNVLIRQEYAWGDDDSGLDNVTIFVPGVSLPTLVGSGCVASNFTFSFQTVTNRSYTVEYNEDLRTTNWLFHHTLIGDGSLMPCLMPMTNTTQRFFRVRQP